MALRLLAFKQIHKILGIECLLQSHAQIGEKLSRKRPFSQSNENIIDNPGIKLNYFREHLCSNVY